MNKRELARGETGLDDRLPLLTSIITIFINFFCLRLNFVLFCMLNLIAHRQILLPIHSSSGMIIVGSYIIFTTKNILFLGIIYLNI